MQTSGVRGRIRGFFHRADAKRRRHSRRWACSGIERLEVRALLATFTWDGGGGDSNWSTAANWDGDVSPVAGDNLVFPVGAAQTAAVNDFAAGTAFGSMLISGSSYSLSGNSVVLDGAVSSGGSSNVFGLDVQLASGSGFAHTGSGTFTVSGAVDTNGHALSVNAAAFSATTFLSGIISGAGSLSTGGSGTTALAGANTYTGTTTVTTGILAVRHNQALGAADGTAATGTIVTGNNGGVQLEGGVSVGNERLTSPLNSQITLSSIGAGQTNIWGGSVESGGHLFLHSNAVDNVLQMDGSVSRFDGGYGILIVASLSNSGTVRFNGGSSNFYHSNVGQVTAEVNSSVNTLLIPYLFGTLGGTGSLTWTNPGAAQIEGTINPGSGLSTGILTTGSVAFQHGSTVFAVQLNGTAAGTQHDQLNVIGSVDLNGNLLVSLGDGFTPAIGNTFIILNNDGTDPVVGSFNGLSEGGLLNVAGSVFRISYIGGTGNDVTLTRVSAGIWDGGGGDSNWSTAANWDGDVSPVAGDNLVFPVGAAQTAAVNDFAAGTAFGSMLISGSNYSLSGNSVVLDGAVSSGGSSNVFGLDVQLASGSGFAHTGSGTFTVSGAVDTNGHALSVNAAAFSATTFLSGIISGAGSLSTGGSGTTALAGANTYTGTTTVTTGILAVRHNQALGAADGTAATGTIVTGNNGGVQLEGGVSVGNERLTSPLNSQITLSSIGAGQTNIWGGSVESGGHLFLHSNAVDNVLQMDGSVSRFDGGYGILIVASLSNSGTVRFNGGSSNFYHSNVGQVTAEVNSSVNTLLIPYLFGTLGGTGSLTWTNPGAAQIEGTINPGSGLSTGILTTGSVAFQHGSTVFAVQLNGTAAGTQHDQLNVIGSVDLNGNLLVSLGDGFTPAIGNTFIILNNDGTDPVVGSFNGLSEGGLLNVAGSVFRISYIGGTGNDVTLTRVSAGIWDGGGGDSNWSTAANWDGDVSPVAGDNLVFPVGAAQTAAVNDFAAGTAFGSMLISGSNYSLSGNSVVLDGAVSSGGSSNVFGLDVQLASGSGFAHTGSGTFTVSGAVDTNGHALSVNAAAFSATTFLSGIISGAGSLSTGGSGTTALAGANTYTGTTTVTTGILAVRHNQALGAADGTAATGTIVTGNNGGVQLEGGVSVGNERLTSPLNSQITLSSIGAGQTNIWGGSVESGGHLFLHSNAVDNVLQMDGSVSRFDGGYGILIVASLSNSGTVRFNGGSSNFYYSNVGQVTAEVNSSVNTLLIPYLFGTLGGTGSLTWTNPGAAQIEGTINPGSGLSTGILTTGSVAFQHGSTVFAVQLNGTAAGTQHDQLNVIGSVDLNGNLLVSLGDGYTPAIGNTFTILNNDGTDPIIGSFNGLSEGGLLNVAGSIFRISYIGGTGNDVTLTTVSVNNAPTGVAQTLSTEQDTALPITLTGSDPDGDAITFSIAENPQHGTLSGTGAGRTYTPATNYTGPDSFVFRVTDAKGATNVATVSITVRTNHAPTNILLSAISVAENKAVGTTVGTLSTLDPDSGNTFTYSLASGAGGTDNSSFTISGNELQTAAVFDFESKSSYSIRVRSTDQGGLSTEKTFTISVIDVAEVGDTIVLDNNATTGITSSGSWTVSTAIRPFVDDNYQFHQPNASAFFRWSPNIPTGGVYRVFLQYPTHAQAGNPLVQVTHKDGTTAGVRVDQTSGGGGDGFLLGTYSFDAGSTGSVTMRPAGATNWVLADAVRFVRVADLPVNPIAAISNPGDGGSIHDFVINGRNYIDVTFSDFSGSGLDAASIVDIAPEFVLSGAGAGVSINGTPTLVSGTTYRFQTTGQFSVGIVTVHFSAGSFSDHDGNVNHASTTSFVVNRLEVVLDNSSPTGITRQGSWRSSRSIPGFVGNDYEFTTPNANDFFRWTPDLVVGGQYEVYLQYPNHGNSASTARVDVTSLDGTTTRTVNMRDGGQNGGFLLGTFSFSAGTGGSITLRAINAGGTFVIADAVRLVRIGASPKAGLSDPVAGGLIAKVSLNDRDYIDVVFSDVSGAGLDAGSILDADTEFTLSGPGAAGVTVSGIPTLVSGTSSTYRYLTAGDFSTGDVDLVFGSGAFFDLDGNANQSFTQRFTVGNVEVVLDNSSPTGITRQGSWRSSTSIPGYVGTHYEFTQPNASAFFRWTPTLPSDGRYEVYLQYPNHPSSATTARVDVTSLEGTTTRTVNMTRDGGNGGYLLGTFGFGAGTGGSITLRAINANGNFVIADAVRLVRVGDLPI